MNKPAKRQYVSRGKGFLSAAGPQARFSVFLIFLLITYTLLLKVFQKLTGIVELPVFLPIALVTLLLFIGVAGTLYSHKFVGPITRIRKTLEHIASGDCSVSLRLRESDDPMMKEFAQSVTNLCERSRSSRRFLQDAADSLIKEVGELAESIGKGADSEELEARLKRVHLQRAAFEEALKSL